MLFVFDNGYMNLIYTLLAIQRDYYILFNNINII